MTVTGYVFIQVSSGYNITAPAGLNVYAKEGSSVIANTTTDSSGHYGMPISGPTDGTPFDMWVGSEKITTLTFYSYNVTVLNMTVIYTTPPSIQVISPVRNVPAGQPTWINATVTDNVAVNATTISMTLNGTTLSPTYNSVTGLLSCQTTPLAMGLYVASIYAANLAGINATETWNFTAAGTAPAITISSPTTASPVYTRSGEPIQVIFNYTEPSPLNWTITISNATYTVVPFSNTTAITPGAVTTTVNVTIPQAAPGGTYNLAVTMYNNYSLSATANQTNAVVIDNTPPIVAITYPTQGENVTTSQVWINGTVTEADMGNHQPTINDSRFTLPVWVNTTGAFAFTGTLLDGAASVNVSFTDLAGNIGSSTVTFTVDTGPHIGIPYQNPPGQYTNSSVTLYVMNNTSVIVTANITDVIGVTSATLSYNNGSGWVNLTMSLTTGNQYTATIPGQGWTAPSGTKLTYYITAINSLTSTARTPAGQLYYPYVVTPEFGSFAVLLLTLAIGTVVVAVMSKTKHPRKTYQ
jgi:hypothetical protein